MARYLSRLRCSVLLESAASGPPLEVRSALVISQHVCTFTGSCRSRDRKPSGTCVWTEQYYWMNNDALCQLVLPGSRLASAAHDCNVPRCNCQICILSYTSQLDSHKATASNASTKQTKHRRITSHASLSAPQERPVQSCGAHASPTSHRGLQQVQENGLFEAYLMVEAPEITLAELLLMLRPLDESTPPLQQPSPSPPPPLAP